MFLTVLLYNISHSFNLYQSIRCARIKCSVIVIVICDVIKCSTSFPESYYLNVLRVSQSYICICMYVRVYIWRRKCRPIYLLRVANIYSICQTLRYLFAEHICVSGTIKQMQIRSVLLRFRLPSKSEAYKIFSTRLGDL